VYPITCTIPKNCVQVCRVWQVYHKRLYLYMYVGMYDIHTYICVCVSWGTRLRATLRYWTKKRYAYPLVCRRNERYTCLPGLGRFSPYTPNYNVYSHSPAFIMWLFSCFLLLDILFVFTHLSQVFIHSCINEISGVPGCPRRTSGSTNLPFAKPSRQ